ncbi:adhesin [Paraliobacillus sediminis]|uniref:adhesin n=1 Tax=Paraliobacillus sediminis TaxID=1885916 RepID=UPI000E3BA290|nr:adhesin [Paraliobacillus sediminis]
MNITEKAKIKLEGIFTEKNVDSMRFYAMESGCCGPQIGISIDAPEATDTIKEINGIKVAIDPDIKDAVEGLTLDDEETSDGTQFVLLGMDQCC